LSRESRSAEYATMYNAVEKLLRQFPDIRRDISNADKDSKPLVGKIRKV
jgi:hypothetical protein